jgi:hypothetical protein
MKRDNKMMKIMELPEMAVTIFHFDKRSFSKYSGMRNIAAINVTR